jgi:hypothetical protein
MGIDETGEDEAVCSIQSLRYGRYCERWSHSTDAIFRNEYIGTLRGHGNTVEDLPTVYK